jgi:hypothetical protein
MLPFTLLAIAITKPDFFDINSLFSRVSEIPSLFSNIPYYLIFIIALEIAMRTIELFAGFIIGNNLEKSPEEEELE